MRRFIALLFAAVAGMSSAGAPPALSMDEACGPAATYTAVVKLVPVRVTESMKTEDGLCVYRSEVGTRGWAAWKRDTITETAQFRVEDGRIDPVSYFKHDGFSKKDRDIVTRFMPDGEVISLYRGEEVRHEVDRPVYDLLSLRRALGLDLAAGRLAERYLVVDGRGRIEEIAVAAKGTETVQTGVGSFEAVRIEYGSDEERFVAWAAPELDYRFARLEQYEDGDLRGRLDLETYGD